MANPLCVDNGGAPLSYESYSFSPRQVRTASQNDYSIVLCTRRGREATSTRHDVRTNVSLIASAIASFDLQLASRFLLGLCKDAVLLCVAF